MGLVFLILLHFSIYMILLQRPLIMCLSLRMSLTKKIRCHINSVRMVKVMSTCEQPLKQYSEYDVARPGKQITRDVKPYIFEYISNAKKRWLGRELFELLCNEFGAPLPSYWVNAIKNGQVKVNNRPVDPRYVVKMGDIIAHRAHRHEPTVFGEVLLVDETEDLIAVSKPSSLPMHPSGNYRYNSLISILEREPLIPDQPPLLLTHRLDRVTSGLVVLAKHKKAAANLSEAIRDKETVKVYLARVRGKFPRTPDDVPHLRSIETIHLPDYCNEAHNRPAHTKSQLGGGAGGGGGGVEDCEVGDVVDDDKKTLAGQALSWEDIGKANNVGVMFTKCVSHVLENEPILRNSMIHAISPAFTPSSNFIDRSPSSSSSSSSPALTSSLQQKTCEIGNKSDGVEIFVSCPLDVLDPRDGIHACDPTGKPSLSIFRCLGYCPESDTSLIECRPYTGRTHQLRLHLQLLGTPIANDPLYGGELFYGDVQRRESAIKTIHYMREKQIIPLSKISRFGDPVIDALLRDLVPVKNQSVSYESASASAMCASFPTTGERSVEVAANRDENIHNVDLQYPTQALEVQSELDGAILSCRNCNDKNDVALEKQLQCDGIWLHALRYSGPRQPLDALDILCKPRKNDDARWSFQAPYPDWAEPFGLMSNK